MLSDRQRSQAISRCVSAMIFYHDASRSGEVVRWVVAEIRAIANEVAGWGIDGEETYRSILRPVEDDLILRFGHEVGPRLSHKFIDDFEAELVAAEDSRSIVANRPGN
jgi:hypothetical protein